MKAEKYYKVIITCGHLGKRRSIEVTRYFKDFDIMSCYDSAYFMPRCKKNNMCIKLVQLINKEEYLMAEETEKYSDYLMLTRKMHKEIA